jgi:hypothetical protein
MVATDGMDQQHGSACTAAAEGITVETKGECKKK